jgi:hypothetical protein
MKSIMIRLGGKWLLNKMRVWTGRGPLEWPDSVADTNLFV